MRPSPNPRHLVAVLILIGVAGAYAYLGLLDSSFSDEQIASATAVRKLHDGSAFPADFTYGPTGLWRLRSGVFERMILPLYSIRPDRPLWPTRLLVGPMSLLYLLSMYALLFGQTRSWSVSVVVAALSSVTIEAAGGAFWGTGPLWAVSPLGLSVAMTPLAALALAGRSDLRSLLGAGVVMLAITQLHPGWSVNLALALLVACLLDRPPKDGIKCAAVLLGALVIGSGFTLWLRSIEGVPTGQAELPMGEVVAAFSTAGSMLLYPRLLERLAQWGLVAAGLAVPSILILLRMERYRARHLLFWLALGGGALVVGLVLSLAAQGLGALLHQVWYVGFPMALAIVLLPIWVLLAQALTVLFRIFRPWRHLIGWVLGILAVLWFLPSDNVRVIRHQAYALASTFMEQEDKPRRLGQIHERRDRQAELDVIAMWAAHETDPAAAFISNQAILRLRSGRSLPACPQDLLPVLYLQPARLGEWAGRLERINLLLQPPQDKVDAQAVVDFAAELSSTEPLDRVTQWYIILPAQVQVEPHELLQPIDRPEWGNHYRLYRVR